MKKLLLSFLATVLVAPTLTMGIVQAVSDQPDTTSQIASTHDETADSADARLQRLQAIMARVRQRKASQHLSLTTLQKARIELRCEFAQGRLSSLSGRIKGIATSRARVYDNLTKLLTRISQNIKTKGLNTHTLDAQIAVLQQKITNFNTALDNYKQAVADLAAMDCKADPEGFKASLETARDQRQTLFETARGVRSYVHDTIRATLKDLRSQLAAQEESSHNEMDH